MRRCREFRLEVEVPRCKGGEEWDPGYLLKLENEFGT